MIETIITICALTLISPYYDCNNEWDIIIYDKTTDIIPGTDKAIGSASYSRPIFDKPAIGLVHDYKERVGKWDHMTKGGGVLWHEILHMKCKCDWHARWDVLEDIEGDNRSHIRIPTIPQSVIPFLKGDWR